MMETQVPADGRPWPGHFHPGLPCQGSQCSPLGSERRGSPCRVWVQHTQTKPQVWVRPLQKKKTQTGPAPSQASQDAAAGARPRCDPQAFQALGHPVPEGRCHLVLLGCSPALSLGPQLCSQLRHPGQRTGPHLSGKSSPQPSGGPSPGCSARTCLFPRQLPQRSSRTRTPTQDGSAGSWACRDRQRF